MAWDNGTWVPEVDDVDGSLRKGELKFKLLGKKLKGSWILIRTRGFGSKSGMSWLLIKNHDEYASTKDIIEKAPRSIVSKRLLAEIALDNGGNVEKAATGDPPRETKVAVRRKRNATPRDHFIGSLLRVLLIGHGLFDKVSVRRKPCPIEVAVGHVHLPFAVLGRGSRIVDNHIRHPEFRDVVAEIRKRLWYRLVGMHGAFGPYPLRENPSISSNVRSNVNDTVSQFYKAATA
jgi:hypothetical protein